MKVEVRIRGFEPVDALREHVARRVHFQLSRFDGAVTSVVVQVSDINGPKGGVDKRCHLTVRGPALRALTIEDLSADPYSAVDMALERAARTLRRTLVRARDARRPTSGLRRAS